MVRHIAENLNLNLLSSKLYTFIATRVLVYSTETHHPTFLSSSKNLF